MRGTKAKKLRNASGNFRDAQYDHKVTVKKVKMLVDPVHHKYEDVSVKKFTIFLVPTCGKAIYRHLKKDK